MPNALAAWCAHNGFSESAHQYSQRKHRKHPASPTQWFTNYTRPSRGPLAVLTPSVRDTAPRSPVGLRATSANPDADHGAPEPHDFSVRDTAARLARRDHGLPALRSPLAHDSVASTASRPAFVTIAIRPSQWDGMTGSKHKFPKNGSKIFLAIGLDRKSRGQVICASGKGARI